MKRDILDDLHDTEILLVEDDVDLRNLIDRHLRRHAKALYSVGEGKKALKIFQEKSPHVIITDLDLPKMSGLEFIKEVRDINPRVAVVIITAFGTRENLIESYDLGACSILKKPIDLEELSIILLANTPKKITKTTVSLGNNLSYNPIEMTLYDGSKSVVLTKKENKILSLLLQYRGGVVSYDEFQSMIWGETPMTLDTLRMHINSIRKKSHQNIIRNLSGVGYKLTME
ncbi:hypothetical protein CCZ01_03590 [Helicobacter monodelphidis]|uniref:response regulator transcription factor n=1 Tax=Helicobacter sp. 15-1451 TaxID=2004995 RepID=UPI000DCB2D9A|nr:response regulator transcription factor [Helicobacter sp. 15-1451]RAX58168.1 hypothetical protein CCZ01_03590 [Helicobacter sp. 15-1451]